MFRYDYTNFRLFLKTPSVQCVFQLNHELLKQINQTIQNDSVLYCYGTYKCHKIVDLLLMCRNASAVLFRYVVYSSWLCVLPVGLYTYSEVIHVVPIPVKYISMTRIGPTCRFCLYFYGHVPLSAYDIHQGCTNVCGSSAWNLLHVTFPL